MSSNRSPVDTAVILAAGNGRRLHPDAQAPPSKPLTRVGGVPLIVRTLVHLKRKGVRRAVVVTGYRADEVRATLEGEARLEGLDVVFAHNGDWRKSNGVSVLTARPHVKGEFLLLMADHVFSPDMLDVVLREEARPDADGAVLAIDRKIDDVYDLDDATLVRTDSRGAIVAISKELSDFDAVDTGLFRCSSGLFSALQAEQTERGDCSLSNGVQRLAGQGRMGTIDVGAAWWQDVDTPGASAHAEHMLFEACRKPVDGLVARHFNRNISLFVSRRLKDLPIHPNAVSVFNMLLGVAAAFAVMHPTYGWLLLGALLLEANSVLDGVDGELARVRLQESKRGEWLDTLADDGSNILFFLGLSIGAAQLPGGTHLAIAGGIAVAAQLTLCFIRYRDLLAIGRGDLYALEDDFFGWDPAEQTSLGGKLLAWTTVLLKQDSFITFFVVMAVLGLLPWILWLVAAGEVGALVALMFRTARVRARQRERAAA